MVAVVPSLTGSLYLTDVQSILTYQLQKAFRVPKNAIPILPDLILSVPEIISRFADQPEILCSNIQSGLQNIYNRIFNGERQVNVSVTYTTESIKVDTYDVTISIIYTTLSGDLAQTGTTVSLVGGRLVIPEDSLAGTFGSVL